ncbi:MAG: TetR/AcrR family transcriptional regulator [Lachnospiraceae bacterium]|nr:TetR/AcrR family transcriptional regulator [Lachnospiraceae bacterium]
MKKKDLRIIRTEENLRKSLISLLKENNLSSITISKLSALAGIDRRTFYLHYSSVTELLNTLLEDLSKDFLQTLAICREEKAAGIYRYEGEDRNYAFLNALFRLINNNKDLCLVLFSDHLDISYIQSVFQSIYQPFANYCIAKDIATNEIQIQLLFTFFVNGGSQIVKYWLEHEDSVSREYVVTTITFLLESMERNS